MKTTNYICDVCTKSKSEDDLIAFKVNVTGLKIQGASGYNKNALEKDICKSCLEKKGFVILAQSEEEIKQAEIKKQGNFGR